MKRYLNAASATVVMLAIASQALAQTPVPPPAPATSAVEVPPPAAVSTTGDAPAAAAAPEGSVFVRCDGSPPNMGGGELAARLLMITATGGVVGGLIGAPEVGDAGKRLKGVDGVQACDQALAKETNETRRVQLTMARAIHNIEADRHEAALTDARSVPTVAGAKADRAFSQSLALGALELEAATLVRMGRPAEAEATALRMAEAAPYDLVTQIRAAKYAGLTAEMTPAKAAYLDRYVKLFPPALLARFEARQWAGDYAGSAADLERLDAIRKAFFSESEPLVLSTARRSAAYMLAGDMTRSNALAIEARAAVDKLVRSGKALDQANVVSQAEELLDFQAAGRMLAEGKVKEARVAFAARSRWLAPSPPAVALLTERLRAGATPAELTGALARDPVQLRADGLSAKAGALSDPEDESKTLFTTVRLVTRNAYGQYTSAIWKGEKSRYLMKRTPKSTYTGDLIFIYGAYGAPGGEAILLQCAVLAKARGKSGFMLSASRNKLDSTLVQVGDPGDPGMVDGMVIDADQVIAALSADMPRPMPR